MKFSLPQHGWPESHYRYFPSLLATTMVALVSGTPNAFNDSLAPNMQLIMGVDDGYMRLLNIVVLIGLYLTLPAGYLLDRAGPAITTGIGAILCGGGYLVAGFCTHSKVGMVISLALMGFGSGASFMAALGTALKMGAVPTGMASGGMSLCLALFTLLAKPVPESKRIALFGWTTGITMALGALILHFAWITPSEERNDEEGDGDVSEARDDGPLLEEKTMADHWVEKEGTTQSLGTSLRSMLTSQFWRVVIGYYAGLGIGMLIIEQRRQLWLAYASNHPDGVATVGSAFSWLSCATNLLAAPIASRLVKRYPSRTQGVLMALVFGVVALFLLIIGGMTSAAKNQAPSSASIGMYGFTLALSGVAFGATVTVVPMIAADVWGSANVGVFFSLLQIGSLGAVVSIPLISAGLFEVTSSFAAMLYFSAVLLVIGVVCMMWKRT